MSLQESELLAIAAAYADRNRPGPLNVPPAHYTFAARVLRLRPASRLLILAADAVGAVPARPVVPAQTIVVSVTPPARGAGLSPIRASFATLPLRSGTIDAIAEFGPSAALAIESDDEAVAVLRELARILRAGGRYLCGGTPALTAAPPRASTDKRRLDEWRYEGRDVLHHTLSIVRADGSWRRLHERLRLRGLAPIEALLGRAGFTTLNAFAGYDQQHHATGPSGSVVLLCEKR